MPLTLWYFFQATRCVLHHVLGVCVSCCAMALCRVVRCLKDFPFTDGKNCAEEVRLLNFSHNRILSMPKDVTRFLINVTHLDVSFNQLETLPEQVCAVPCAS
jgi:hypothetical protein